MAFNQFVIQVEDTQLDTYDDETILLNYSIVDILDIASRNTSFSKEITIPGTPKNNQFFQNIFDVNVDLEITSYNPKRAIPAQIIIGGTRVFQGNLQLVSIIKNQKSVEYSIILTGILKNLIYNFGDFSLQQLDLEEYNHTRNKQVIQDSWTYNIYKNGAPYDAVIPGEGYVYPHIIYGNSQDISNISYVYDNYPAVYAKTIMDKLFDFGGYTYTSEFFNSDYFRKLIVPFVNDSFQLTEAQKSGLTNTAGVDVITKVEGNMGVLTNSLSSYEMSSGGNTITGFRQLHPVRKRNTGWGTNATAGYYLPFDKLTGSVGSINMNNPDNRFTNNQTQFNYTCNTDGFYKIGLEFQFLVKYINMNGSKFRFQSGNFKYYSRLWLKKLNQPAVIIDSAPVTIPGTFQPSTGLHNSPWYDTNTVLNVSQGVPSIYLNAGDKIYVEFLFEYGSSPVWLNEFFVPIANQILAVPMIQSVSGGLPNYLTIEPVANNIQTPVINVNLNQMLPNMKMKDFFMSIVRMFNLYVYDNPLKTNDLIIEPMDNFYGSKTRLKDWTKLLDRDTDIELVPMSELDVKLYNYSYTPDEDYFNKQYTEETKEVFGEETINFVNDFSTEEKEITISFSPTPDSNMFIGTRVSPFFTSIENNVLTPVRPKPRILFYDGLKSCSPYKLKTSPNDTTPTNLTQYPYCGMWDDPYDPKYDLSFGVVQKVYYNNQVYPNNNLITLWYDTTFNEITDVNGKLLVGYFYLSVKEISDFDFRDLIYIDGSYWRVNKIVDYDPVRIDKLTKVELYKISDITYFPLDQSDASDTDDCPTDIISQYNTTQGFIYVSQSGLPISAECCAQYGGIWVNGVCKRKKQVPVINKPSVPQSPVVNPVGTGVLVGGGLTGGGLKPGVSPKPNITKPTEKPVSASKDLNSINSPGIQVQGKNNYVPTGAQTGIILGDNNTIRPDFTNVLVVGNNISPTEDNSIVVGDLLITSDGLKWNNVYIIDGGLNETMNVSKTNFIDVIDGGLNSVRNLGGDSKLRPIIDDMGNGTLV